MRSAIGPMLQVRHGGRRYFNPVYHDQCCQLNQLGSKATSDSTLKQSTTYRVSNTMYYFYFFMSSSVEPVLQSGSHVAFHVGAPRARQITSHVFLVERGEPEADIYHFIALNRRNFCDLREHRERERAYNLLFHFFLWTILTRETDGLYQISCNSRPNLVHIVTIIIWRQTKNCWTWWGQSATSPPPLATCLFVTTQAAELRMSWSRWCRDKESLV